MGHGTSMLPPTEQLAQTPVACSAGTCFVHAQRAFVEGESRYIYAIFNRTNFWRYDTWTDTWQQMASPAVIAAAVFGAGVAMCYDASRGQIWMFTPMSIAPWYRLEIYSISLNGWSTPLGLGVIPGLAAQWGTSAQLLHPCSTECPTAVTPLDQALLGVQPAQCVDDYLYLIGNNSTTMYRFAINATPPGQASATWVALNGAGGVRGGAPGTGACLQWMPDLDPSLEPVLFVAPAGVNNRLLSLRGNGTAVLDNYTVSTDTWDATTVIQPANTFTLGSCTAYDPSADGPSLVVYRDATMMLYSIEGLRTNFGAGNTLVCTPTGTLAGVDGVAHIGNLLTVARFEDGSTYYYFAKHSERAFMRILRAE